MKVYDMQLAKLVPGDMNVNNSNTAKDMGKIIRYFYTNGGLFQDHLGPGIQVSTL